MLDSLAGRQGREGLAPYPAPLACKRVGRQADPQGEDVAIAAAPVDGTAFDPALEQTVATNLAARKFERRLGAGDEAAQLVPRLLAGSGQKRQSVVHRRAPDLQGIGDIMKRESRVSGEGL